MKKLGTRDQTLGEEIANSISHGIGFLGALVITPIMISAAVPSGVAGIAGASVFGVTMMILYLASTLYHAFPHSRTKRVFQILDHAAIFLLIAGTYTPFTLSVLPGPWGWSLFGIVWGLAIFGIVLKSIGGAKTSRLSIALYLGMGWVAVFAAEPLFTSLPAQGLLWIVMGGLLYSAGVVFFVYDHKTRFNHFIWHLFVMGGTACHVVAVLLYAYQATF